MGIQEEGVGMGIQEGGASKREDRYGYRRGRSDEGNIQESGVSMHDGIGIPTPSPTQTWDTHPLH